jgi:hypothetical protein
LGAKKIAFSDSLHTQNHYMYRLYQENHIESILVRESLSTENLKQKELYQTGLIYATRIAFGVCSKQAHHSSRGI